jgi:rhodanese-related sulfurtransferase
MWGQPEVASIGPAEVAEKQAAGWMLLDVRTDEEWAEGRIAGATHIPLNELVARLDEVTDPVVCICAMGGRSARATQFLQAQGREAVNLDGGVQAWAAQGGRLQR